MQSLSPPQTDSTSDVVALFSVMNDLGTELLTETNITNVTADNIGTHTEYTQSQ